MMTRGVVSSSLPECLQCSFGSHYHFFFSHVNGGAKFDENELDDLMFYQRWNIYSD